MKDIDHPVVHPRVHHGDRASAQRRRAYVYREDKFGRGQNTVLGWSDPTSLPPNPRRSLQPNRSSPGQGVWPNHMRMYQVEYDGLQCRPIGRRKREMPVLKSPPKLIRNATIQVRVEEEIDTKLRKYAEFIDATPAFVVAESLKMLFYKALRANISETGLVLLINEQLGEKEEIRDEWEFSWCCSFPWGFGWRGTERRRAKRAAAQCSASQSRRRFGHSRTAGPRSSCQTEAADLHSGVQTTHLTRSRGRCDDARWPWCPAPPRRSVLVAADLLAARAGRWNPRSLDSAETRAEVQAQSARSASEN